MKGARLIYVAALSGFILSACKTVRFDKYFPASDKKIYVYKWRNDTLENPAYLDTLVCRVKTAQSVNQTRQKNQLHVISPRNEISGGSQLLKAFYFLDPKLEKSDSPYYKDKSFIHATGIYYKGRLFMSDVFYRNENEWNELFYKVFPRRVKPNSEYVYRLSDFLRIFKVEGHEDIQINNVTHNDCLKITVKEKWVVVYPTDTVWLKKGVGVIKWKKRDGFVGTLQL